MMKNLEYLNSNLANSEYKNQKCFISDEIV